MYGEVSQVFTNAIYAIDEEEQELIATEVSIGEITAYKKDSTHIGFKVIL